MHPNPRKLFITVVLLLLPLATAGCPSVARQRHARQQAAAGTLDDHQGTWDGIAQSDFPGALVRLVIDEDACLVLPDGRVSRLTVRAQEGSSFICSGAPLGGRGVALPRVVLPSCNSATSKATAGQASASTGSDTTRSTPASWPPERCLPLDLYSGNIWLSLCQASR